MDAQTDRKREVTIVEKVDRLSEEVKMLALNLAIYLAKAKPNSKRINEMEPDFVRLVNGTIKVVQEIAQLIAAARHSETMVYDVPSGTVPFDHIGIELQSLLYQVGRIMNSLSPSSDQSG